MRRIYLLVLAVVLVATLVGLGDLRAGGYVLIAYKSFRYESSLWSFLALLAVVWLLVVLVRLVLRLLGSVGYRDAYPELIALLADGRLDLARAVTRSVPLEQAVEHGFEALLRDKSQVKVLVNPNPALADA
ncbi:hypothetical protein AKG06_24575 [Pseudomonas aeruginosa]|nr:hypothetical protein AKG06_24575 [Pseudomonas aeruginosa]